MNDDYKDIIDLPHHVSCKHPQMSSHDRAAQFSPFAALAGYDDAIQETVRQTEKKIEPSEEELDLLNNQLRFLRDMAKRNPVATFTYFVQDPKKAGGKYLTQTGRVRQIDAIKHTVVLTNGLTIPIGNIYAIECPLFCENQDFE